jgi:hypothetical protein
MQDFIFSPDKHTLPAVEYPTVLQGQTRSEIAQQNLQIAKRHGAMSDQHRVIEQLYLISFLIGALSPVRAVSFEFSPLTVFQRAFLSGKQTLPPE